MVNSWNTENVMKSFKIPENSRGSLKYRKCVMILLLKKYKIQNLMFNGMNLSAL